MDLQQSHAHDVEELRKKFPSGHLSLKNHPHPSNITRSHSYKSGASQLNINHLNRVLKIDENKIIVEPRVTMEQLAKAALKEGMMVPVIPEFKGITVGGAIMGAGMESASHKHGLFSDCCLAYEILLGNGSVVRATPQENPDLFYGIVGSYGSLGILLSIELKLIPAKTWVKLKYKKCSSIFEAVAQLQNNQADFVEGLVFAPDHTVIIEGTLTDEPLETVSLKYPWSEWFYCHAKEVPEEEKMPLLDYLFRHDRGAFWIGAYGTHWSSIPRYFLESRLKLPALAKLLPSFKPENFAGPRDPGFLYRFLWGWAMTSHRLYAWLHSKSEDWVANHFIIQDFCIPVENVVPFIEKVFQEIKIFPLWLCPTPSAKESQFLSPHFLKSSYIVNVGIYGISPRAELPGELVKKLEGWADTAGGRKVLYSYSYYTPDEFWKIYSKKDYDHLRHKYHAEALLGLDQKVL